MLHVSRFQTSSPFAISHACFEFIVALQHVSERCLSPQLISGNEDEPVHNFI